MVDGLGVGDVGSIVLRDRKHLAEDGLIVVVAAINTKTKKIVAGPDIISRGFVYVREAEDMINGCAGSGKEYTGRVDEQRRSRLDQPEKPHERRGQPLCLQ